MKANRAWITMATNRKGNNTSQNTGSNTSTANASGQHSSARMQKPINTSSVFIRRLNYNEFVCGQGQAVAKRMECAQIAGAVVCQWTVGKREQAPRTPYASRLYIPLEI